MNKSCITILILILVYSSSALVLPRRRAVQIAKSVWDGFIRPAIEVSVCQGLTSAAGNDSRMDDFWNLKYNNNTLAQCLTRVLEDLGPTYVKFGQALSARADVIPMQLADSLATLQDQMEAFPTDIARDIIQSEIDMSEEEMESFLSSLSLEPVAAASIGQVYSAYLPRHGKVAIKVKRPGIESVVAQDAELLKSIARFVEGTVAAKVEDAVDEFMTRLFEELDYRKEVSNMKDFAELYSMKEGTSSKVKVVVPSPIEDYCTDNCIVMTWVEGVKLSDVDPGDEQSRSENLRLVERGIECTLSQLLDTGLLHSDPVSGII